LFGTTASIAIIVTILSPSNALKNAVETIPPTIHAIVNIPNVEPTIMPTNVLSDMNDSFT